MNILKVFIHTIYLSLYIDKDRYLYIEINNNFRNFYYQHVKIKNVNLQEKLNYV